MEQLTPFELREMASLMEFDSTKGRGKPWEKEFAQKLRAHADQLERNAACEKESANCGSPQDHADYLEALVTAFGEDMGDGAECTLSDEIERLKRLAEQGVAMRQFLGPDSWHVDGDGITALLKARLGEWQPISTAPKDGTEILGFCPHLQISKQDPSFRQAIIWWRGEQYKDSEWKWRSVLNDAAVDNPTHWQPLPAPPGDK